MSIMDRFSEWNPINEGSIPQRWHVDIATEDGIQTESFATRMVAQEVADSVRGAIFYRCDCENRKCKFL